MKKFTVYSRTFEVVKIEGELLHIRLPEPNKCGDPILELLTRTITRAIRQECFQFPTQDSRIYEGHRPFAGFDVEWTEYNVFSVRYFAGNHHCGTWVEWEKLDRNRLHIVLWKLFDTHDLTIPTGAG